MNYSFQEDSQDTYLYSTHDGAISEKTPCDSSQETLVLLYKCPNSINQQNCKIQIENDENNLDTFRWDKPTQQEQNNDSDNDQEQFLFQVSPLQKNDILVNNYDQIINNNQPFNQQISNKINFTNENQQTKQSLLNDRIENQIQPNEDYKLYKSFIENPFEIIFDGKVQENSLPTNIQYQDTIYNQILSDQSRYVNTLTQNNNQNDFFNNENNQTNASFLNLNNFNQILPHGNINEQNKASDNPVQSLLDANFQQINNLYPNNQNYNMNNNQPLNYQSRLTDMQIQNCNQIDFSNGNSKTSVSPFYSQFERVEDQNKEILNIDFLTESQKTKQPQQNSYINKEIQTDNLFSQDSQDVIQYFNIIEKITFQQLRPNPFQDSESQFNQDKSFNQDSKQEIYSIMDDSFYNHEKLNNQASTISQGEDSYQPSETNQELPRQLNEQTQQNQYIRKRRRNRKKNISQTNQELLTQVNEQAQQNLQKKKRNRKRGEINQFGKPKNQETNNFANYIFEPFFDLLKTFHPQIKSLQTNSLTGFDSFLQKLPQDEYELFQKTMLLIVDTHLINIATSSEAQAQYEILKYLPGLKLMIQNRGKFISIKQANKSIKELNDKNQ